MATVRGSSSSPTDYESRSYNKTTGESRTYRRVFTSYTGAAANQAYNDCATEYASLKASGTYDALTMEPDSDNARWILTGTLQDETTQITHELIGHEVLKDSQLSAVFQSKITDEKASLILKVIADLQKADPATYSTAYSTATGQVSDIAAKAGVGSSADCLTFFDDRLAGRDSYKSSGVTFRKTITAPFSTYVDISYTNVGAIFTTAELKTEESIHADYDLPSGYWLKKYPMNSKTLGVRQQWVVEYEFTDVFSDLYYAAKT